MKVWSTREGVGSCKLQRSSHNFSEFSQTSISIPMTQWKHKQCNTTNIIQQIYLCVNRLDGYVQGVYKLERPKTSYILMYMES